MSRIWNRAPRSDTLTCPRCHTTFEWGGEPWDRCPTCFDEHSDERRVAATLRPRTGLVAVSPVNPPASGGRGRPKRPGRVTPA